MSLGNKIKELRQEKNWSQDEFAFHAQIDGRQVSRYENDKVTPSIEVVVKIAKAFNVSIDYLLIDEIPKRPLQSAHGKLVEKVLTMEHFSDEDERCLLHLIDSLEGKNKLRVLVEGLK